MKFLREVCLKPKNNRLDFGDNLDCDPDPDLIRISQICKKLLSEVCLCRPRTDILNFGNDPDYDRDPD